MTKSNVGQYLQTDSKTLGSLLTRLKQLNHWNIYLRECLAEDELIHHCQIVNLSGNSLIVIADNPHWMTRLRFHIPELLKKLRVCQGLEKIQGICCKVQPNYIQAKTKKRHSPQIMSDHTAAAIRDIANKLQDEKLRLILEKIASRCKNPEKT